MKDMLYGVLALISAIIAAYFLYSYVGQGENADETTILPFVGAIVFVLLTLGFGALFLSGRVNKTEDIHITE